MYFSYKKTIISHSPSQTKEIGRRIIHTALRMCLKKTIVIILSGDIGAGKTVLVKGIAQYLGINTISSPTFVIVHEYDLMQKKIRKFYHIDFYRLESEKELFGINFANFIKEGNVICIEWGDKFNDFFGKLKGKICFINVNLKHIDEKKRKITFFFNQNKDFQNTKI